MTPTNDPLSHRITAVREPIGRCAEEYHNDIQTSVKQVGRQAKFPTDPPRKTPCVLWAGRYVSLRGCEAFAPFCARMPPVLVESADPFSEKGSRSAFFWHLFFAEAKKSAKNLNQQKIQNNFNQTPPLQKLIFPTPNLN